MESEEREHFIFYIILIIKIIKPTHKSKYKRRRNFILRFQIEHKNFFFHFFLSFMALPITTTTTTTMRKINITKIFLIFSEKESEREFSFSVCLSLF